VYYIRAQNKFPLPNANASIPYGIYPVNENVNTPPCEILIMIQPSVRPYLQCHQITSHIFFLSSSKIGYVDAESRRTAYMRNLLDVVYLGSRTNNSCS